MSSINTTDVSSLLEHWSDAKAKITELENMIKKYKRLANRVMKTQDSDIISSTYYTLKRKQISRYTISKLDVPEHIWEKYSKPCSYSAYYLSEN